MKTRRLLYAVICLGLLAGTCIFAQTITPGGPSTAAGSFPASVPGQKSTVSLAEAVDLALAQASNFKQAQITELIAKEDIRQARAAFYPTVTAKPNYIYTSPSFGSARPRPPSFVGANAVNEIQGLVNASGEIDTSGKLRATLLRDQALLSSAHAGSEIARQDLIVAVTEAYLNLSLSTAKRRLAESNITAAEDFEKNIRLQLGAGEIAPVDLIRARLQTAARHDDLELAKADEAVNSNSLRFLIGFTNAAAVTTEDLLIATPADGEIERFTDAAIASRPEFAQFAADKAAAEQDVNVARSERRPQLTYSASSGVITDSLAPSHLKDSLGVQVSVGVTIPIWDHGASRSREAQAKLKIQLAENAKALAERQFAQTFFTARAQAYSAKTRIKQLGAAIDDAQQNVDASTARYRAGEAAIIEVTDAQNLLIAQKLLLYQALFDYRMAKAHLARAVGQ